MFVFPLVLGVQDFYLFSSSRSEPFLSVLICFHFSFQIVAMFSLLLFMLLVGHAAAVVAKTTYLVNVRQSFALQMATFSNLNAIYVFSYLSTDG